MIYVKLNELGKACRVLDAGEVAATCQAGGEAWDTVKNRNDWESFAQVEKIAQELTEATGRAYLGTDSGPNVSPRYDVTEAPVVGDEVSEYFNGDSYPRGTIVKVSASFRRVQTSTGVVFHRRKLSGAWVHQGWSMIAGHHNDRNPSF